ncbi:hypothetical protein HYQ46_013368 [Verticillium longisporum]|nr:hypothetical protein HYQ46_013368 [Verticillium longisporum]
MTANLSRVSSSTTSA